jgi:hypothetical protein
MILGIEDIAGGTTILAFLIWLGLSAIFYLVSYLAALNQPHNPWCVNGSIKLLPDPETCQKDAPGRNR